MKWGLFGLATVATLALGAGTASAQYRYRYNYYPAYVPTVVPRLAVTASAPVVVTAGATATDPPTVALNGTPVVTLGTEFVPTYRPVYVPYRTWYPGYYRYYHR
jgi:hypothetical protein